jgi:hypothetical protein
MNVAVIHRLAQKAIATTERIEREQLAAATPGLRERHEDIVIVDDAERGKVLVQFPKRVDERTRRVPKIYGFCGRGDGAHDTEGISCFCALTIWSMLASSNVPPFVTGSARFLIPLADWHGGSGDGGRAATVEVE